MKRSTSHQDNHAIALERLKALGERRTPARQAILTLLLDADNALSHQDIHELLKARNEPFDRVTLYRVLDWLVAQKLAHKLAGLRWLVHPITSNATVLHFISASTRMPL